MSKEGTEIQPTELETPRAEVERLRAREQVMREALRKSQDQFERVAGFGDLNFREAYAAILAALTPDAPSTLLTRDQVQPLVEALEAVGKSHKHFNQAGVELIEDALAHARTLGLL